MHLENVLQVPERHAAILYGNGDYRMFFADIPHILFNKMHDFVSSKAVEIGSGKGFRNLQTKGIRTCAGVMYQNEENYVLLHAYGSSNLAALLSAINPLSIEDAKSNPKETHLCTPNWSEDYESIIKESFEGHVVVNRYQKRWLIGMCDQSATIGKDMLDVDDGFRKPIRFSDK